MTTEHEDDPVATMEPLQPRRMVVANPDGLASAIITESIPPERREDYLRWIRGINRAAESFRGYRETNVFPPLRPDEWGWVTIIHFQTHADLENWLGSDVRAEWVDRFRKEFGDFALHRVQGGLTSWFAQQRIPGWKMVLTVLLGLYPTVMVITLVILPPFGIWPFALTMLVGNILSVSALQWVLMPQLNRILGFWLQPAALVDRRSNLVGSAIVLGATLVMLLLFLALGLHV
jgi:antibiotic biosynthesis monooxygenase (ABM) superfamily enzyme